MVTQRLFNLSNYVTEIAWIAQRNVADQCCTYHPGALVASPSSPVFPSPFESEDLHGHHKLYDNYEDYEEAEVVTFPVSTVHVQLDVTKGGRILVPVLFKLAGGVLIPATILVETGSMANFINKGSVRKFDLKTRQRKTPILCVGFDSREGIGGLVTQDWVGVVQLSSLDSKPVPLPASFGIICLGLVDAIFGIWKSL
ncbi:hypothetical protein PCANC_02618 [Puccinia coronata f. sp. avenae]|uniref:Uncharacterized protein n=1 Tax=Puccinia coronata f. sp. avenae TaxID=200324 RepID=A0A2N5W5G1_9BASI|nr:hypothetical protein PCANC_02618 [Puccinia coronata f. sp. avenae]